MIRVRGLQTVGNIVVVSSVWFTHGNECIGVVMGIDSVTKERKAYVGLGSPGNEESQDVESIVKYGTKIYYSIAEQLYNHLKENENGYVDEVQKQSQEEDCCSQGTEKSSAV